MKTIRSLAALGAAGVLLTACGAQATPASNTQQGFGGQGGPNGPGGQRGGVSGQVAAVSGSTAQVQNIDSQTAVSWTSGTTFTITKATTADAVQVGDCVMANRGRPAVGGNGGAQPQAAPSGPLEAATVRIVATGGSCPTDQFGGVQRRQRPSGAPSGLPSGAVRFGNFAAFGVVTATTGGATPTLTVKSQLPGDSSSTDVTVTTTSATTYTTQVAGTAADVKVGVCLTANGTPNDTGAVTATRISVSDPVNGQCVTRIGRGFGGGGGPAGAGTGGGTGA